MFSPSVTGSDKSTITRSGSNVATAATRERSSATMTTVSNRVSSRPWTPSSMFKWASPPSTRPVFMSGPHVKPVSRARSGDPAGALVTVQRRRVGRWGMVPQEVTWTQLADLRDLSCALRSAGRRSKGDDVVADRVLDQLGGSLDPECLQDAGPVEFRGTRGDLQDRRNLLGRVALGQELQDLALAPGQSGKLVLLAGILAVRLEQFSRDHRRHVRLPSQGLPHRGDQLGVRRMLRNEAGGPGLHGAPCVSHLPVHGQEDHLCRYAGIAKLYGGLDPVERRHRNVGDDHFGSMPFGGSN